MTGKLVETHTLVTPQLTLEVCFPPASQVILYLIIRGGDLCQGISRIILLLWFNGHIFQINTERLESQVKTFDAFPKTN